MTIPLLWRGCGVCIASRSRNPSVEDVIVEKKNRVSGCCKEPAESNEACKLSHDHRWTGTQRRCMCAKWCGVCFTSSSLGRSRCCSLDPATSQFPCQHSACVDIIVMVGMELKRSGVWRGQREGTRHFDKIVEKLGERAILSSV